MPCREIDGVATRTLADYKELALDLLDSARQGLFVRGRTHSPACAPSKLEPHLVRRGKSQLFIQVPTLGAGMQIYRVQTVRFDPTENRDHDLPGNPALAKLRLGIDIQNHRPLCARIFGI